MERIQRGIYMRKFRAEAVKLVEAEGLSIDLSPTSFSQQYLAKQMAA